LRDWLGLDKKEENEKEDGRNKGRKPFHGEVRLSNGNGGGKDSNCRQWIEAKSGFLPWQ